MRSAADSQAGAAEAKGDSGGEARGWAYSTPLAVPPTPQAPALPLPPPPPPPPDKAESIAALQRKLGLVPPPADAPPRPAPAPSPMPPRAPSRMATSNFDAMLPELARRVRVPPPDIPDDEVAAPEVRHKLEEDEAGADVPAASACGAAAVRASCGLWPATGMAMATTGASAQTAAPEAAADAPAPTATGTDGTPAEDAVTSLSALISTGFGCLGRVGSKSSMAGGAAASSTSVTVISEATTLQPPSSPPRDAAAALVVISAASAAADAVANSPASPPLKLALASPPAEPSAPLAFSPTLPAGEARLPAAAVASPSSVAQRSPAEAEALPSPPASAAAPRPPPASPTPVASGYASLSPVMYESLQPRRARKEGAASASPAAALFLDTAPASPALSAGRRSPLRGGASRPAWAEATSPPAAALRPADVSSPPASTTASPRTVAAGAALHSLLAPASQAP